MKTFTILRRVYVDIKYIFRTKNETNRHALCTNTPLNVPVTFQSYAIILPSRFLNILFSFDEKYILEKHEMFQDLGLGYHIYFSSISKA